MNPIHVFLCCFATALFVWFFLSGYYDMKTIDMEQRIAELERENADLHFEVDRAEAVKRDFNEECG